MRRVTRVTALVILQIGWVVATAVAQTPARSFDQLRTLAKPGDTVTVIDATGREFTGKIADLSTTTLALTVEAQQRELTERDVTTIRERRQDSLANGALWGAVIGGGLSLYAANRCANDFSCRDWGAGPILLALGLGAGIGAGVDAAIKSRHVIYERPQTAAVKISVSPLLSGQRHGILASMRF